MNSISSICMTLFIVVVLSNVKVCLSQYSKPWRDMYENNKCPKLYPKNFLNYMPVGNLTAGNYTEKPGLKGLKQCVMECCMSESCNIVFIYDQRCFHVECVSDELCLPLQRTGSRKWEASHVSMILVKPVLPNENWSDILDQSGYRQVNNNFSPEEESVYSPYSINRNDLLNGDEASTFLSRFLNNLPTMDEDEARNFDKYRDNNDSDMIMDTNSFLEKIPCEVDAGDCPFNSVCIPLGMKLRNGICKCVPGTEENAQGACVQIIRPFSKGPTIPVDAMKKNDDVDSKNDILKTETTSQKSIQTLTVSILSKQVQLPDNEVTLAAYTIPDEKATMSHYNYVWTLVDQPKGGFTGNMNQNGAKVTLTDLTEGQYRFKVTVNGTNSYGEGFANVTVLPPHRVNTPPQVVITPQSQTVKLPNTDDDAIISWHWDLTSGPIGYQPPLQDGPTLLLNDLKQPGNYTFKLTVEDSDHVKNSTTANITVLNHTDYPPEANAGQDVIIYLPNNNLTLNGSLSTDDHEITSWEWTKSAEDENKAVDMQNTHSPYLQFISLPQTWIILNGSTSHDDHRIVAYTWRCLSGPTNSNIINFNESVANATALTKGQYVFSLTVLDDNGNSASDNVTVTVTQNKNSPPKADAGGDLVLNLPVSVLILNGSKSSDDFRIVSWKWSRSPSGLAAGTVILNSDTQPVLMLTNIEAGRYVYELTVTDDQGESDKDTVSVQVKPDPLEMNLMELTLNIPISAFTQSQLDSLVQKMTLLLKDDIRVNVTKVHGQIDSGNTQLIFFLSEQGKAVEGIRALSLVRGTSGAWGAWGGARVRSLRCLSACSGRGVCDHATRTCRCDAFWMQSLLSQLDPDAQPDCEWSVVYASLGGVAALCAIGAASWAAARALRKLCAPRKPRARPKYRLLPLADHEEKPFTSKDLSESETDSDVLFETKSKTTSFGTRVMNGEASQGNGWKKNGHYKNSRKVKT
ncbi:hypothetical protein HF086_006863 [Spodoptera exigua]|uniref:PKD/Chitinase domain-containing protein n=1 Tax=Spodoptera exigua TaxID=7107 RepID=A0A922MAX1_SPOEX|nr:hypothetical protein HF086_006863 [Spodoptera exigua]